ncbi:hypothetical protein PDENDC454_10535 [Paenibacillus dendritiformis C454]|uniref:HTH cro/C1-type domain-containing protein n=1 Tax=Paenibacillus dendritiformis C454 TaxID=1131935 RepID=H3SF02_9BACL|nr:XRE family transcriptional regulator [Paenibacillus dendritiformis]EHQ62321.1 hypothetical protein PDENDC454_10535 [Paenibacillus dendritiformis C454]
MNNKNGLGFTSRVQNTQQHFVPDRLRQLRIALGFSTVDFSERIGVSRQALNQFETSRTVPGYETLQRIEAETGFPVGYFFKTISPTNEGPFLFRANRTSLKKTKEMSRFIMLQMQETHEYFSNFLDFKEPNIPPIEFDINSSIDDIEDIAVATRKFWGLGLGPISHVLRLLENNGIVISQVEQRLDKIDAFSQWRNGVPLILVGSAEFSACRLRLNAMHEFAHLLLHTDAEYEEKANTSKEFYDLLEQQAYRLSGAFLLPRESFLDELYSTSLQHLIELKKRWGVSLAAIVRRCKDLEVITESRYELLMRQIKKHGKTEPLDDVIEKERPTVFSQAADLISEHGIKTPQEMIDEMRLPRRLLETIVGVEDGYFSGKSESGKIVNLRSFNKNKANM